MADEDDPDEPYAAPPQSMTANPTGEINVVFSEAIIGAMALALATSLGHPAHRDPPTVKTRRLSCPPPGTGDQPQNTVEEPDRPAIFSRPDAEHQ